MMKSLTPIALARFVLILMFVSPLSFANEGTETLTQTRVTEITLPVSANINQNNTQSPTRGMTMAQVQAKYGPAIKRYPTKGKPPITRWDYSNFSVYFESNAVIHSVNRTNQP